MEQLTILEVFRQKMAFISEPQDIDYNSRKYHEYKARQWNETRIDSEDGIECPLCGNKGTLARVIEIEGFFYDNEDIPCSCMARRRAAHNLDRSGMKSAIENCGKYETNYDWQRTIHAKAVMFVKQLLDDSIEDKARCFYIGGQAGAGKTLICTLMCKTLIEKGYPLIYKKWVALMEELTDYRNERRRELLEELAKVDVLYLDDLLKPCGGGNYTRQELRATFELLDRRYCLPSAVTLISSELTLAQVEKLDMATARRIRDMARGQFHIDVSPDINKIYRPY